LGGDNNLTIQVQRRSAGGTWSNVVSDVTATNGSFDATVTSTGNTVTQSYEFRLYVSDQFNNSAEATTTVTTQRVVLDVHKNEGVGIGKIHEQGVLDVDGEIYLRGGMFLTGEGTGGTSGNDYQLVIDPDDGNSAIEIGSTNTDSLAFIDFHSRAGDNDYDARILTRGGVTGDHGRGILEFTAERLIYRDKVGSDFSARDIIASGTNSNGDWTRFYDGTQIAQRRLTLSRDVSATSAQLAVSFTNEYGIFISHNNNDAWAMENCWLFAVGRLNNGAVSLRRQGTPNSGLTWNTQIIITAIGRWR